MRAAWLAPAALWLAGLAALPIAAHLLSRHRRRRLRFPTLRFLDASSAPVRRHLRWRDPGLLAVRIAVVLAVAAALAGPVLVTAARQAGWDAQTARAVVAAPAVAADPAVAAAERLDAGGEVRRFVTADLRAGVADAAAWLDGHGLSRREIVVVAPLSRGSVIAADASALPSEIGLRFVRAGPLPPDTFHRVRVQLVDGTLWRLTEAVTLEAAATTVREIARGRETGPGIETPAAPADRAAADAARRAVLRRGVVLATPDAAPVVVPWTGRIDALAAAVDARSRGDQPGGEAASIDDTVLAAMTRPPTPRGPSAPMDTGDRRLVWAAVLLLLGVETWLRRRPA